MKSAALALFPALLLLLVLTPAPTRSQPSNPDGGGGYMTKAEAEEWFLSFQAQLGFLSEQRQGDLMSGYTYNPVHLQRQRKRRSAEYEDDQHHEDSAGYDDHDAHGAPARPFFAPALGDGGINPHYFYSKEEGFDDHQGEYVLFHEKDDHRYGYGYGYPPFRGYYPPWRPSYYPPRRPSYYPPRRRGFFPRSGRYYPKRGYFPW